MIRTAGRFIGPSSFRRAVALGLVGLVLTGQALFALSARDRLRASLNLADQAGWSYRNNAQNCYLQKGENLIADTVLYEGSTFKIIGAGDDTVLNLDILVYDENWKLVGRDLLKDAAPIVEVTPRMTGTFHIKIVMVQGYGTACIAICYK